MKRDIAFMSTLPSYLTAEQLESVAKSSCIEPNEVMVTDVCQYGITACIESFTVNTIYDERKSSVKTVLNRINKLIPTYATMIGYYLDEQQNKIGNDGWDFITGTI